MPDKNGNLTQKEIDTLKEQIKTLENLDTNFKNLSAIGQDISQLRKDRDEELKSLKTLVKVYEPLIVE